MPKFSDYDELLSWSAAAELLVDKTDEGLDADRIQRISVGLLDARFMSVSQTPSNVGSGSTLFKQRSGSNDQFKSLTAGTGITLTANTNDVEISKTTIDINTQTGTSYILVLGDAGKLVEMDNASPNTLTVPPNADVAFPTGTYLEVNQYGAGATTLVAGSGVTLRGNLLSKGQYIYPMGLYKRATNEWVVIGGGT